MTDQERKPGGEVGSLTGGSPPKAVGTTVGTKPKRTAEEQRLLDATVKLRGRPLTVQEEDLVLDEAYLIGDL